nr:MAG TPA: hypothetical protein [Caudoviricetes sp.]
MELAIEIIIGMALVALVLGALVLFVFIPVYIALIEGDFYDRLINFWSDKIYRR